MKKILILLLLFTISMNAQFAKVGGTGVTLRYTFTDVLTENLKLTVNNKYYDWQDIKYIEF